MHEGTVLRWYPFLDTMEDLLLGRESRLRCGAGYADYTIMTDGSIAPCPVMVGMKDHYLGHISQASPAGLPELSVQGGCISCEIRTFCGGRCLYSNIVRPWEPEERAVVCGTVRNLYDALSKALPEVRSLIAADVISMENFSHIKFNGCEIIP
jgi:radical SAM protein with 4Fe4S-binding SPASM domain